MLQQFGLLVVLEFFACSLVISVQTGHMAGLVSKMSLTDARAGIVRARALAARAKNAAEEAANRAITTGASAAGGATIAVIESVLDDDNIPGTEVPVGAAITMVGVAAVMGGMGGKQADALGGYVGGMLAVYSYKFTAQNLANEKAPKLAP